MATLDQLISTLPTDSGQKGKAWERLCQWFLQNDPVYASQLRHVWLWDEWPGRWPDLVLPPTWRRSTN